MRYKNCQCLLFCEGGDSSRYA
ncbi:hypothetical protein H4I96_10803 [Botrytis cinerea]